METMDSFDVNEYSRESREVLKKVAEEIREQFLAGGSSRQFWFYVSQASNKGLTESVVQKWLNVLSSKGILHYYKPDYSELERATAFERHCLGEKYEWGPQVITPFVLGFSPHSAPNFAIDLYDTDFPRLFKLISMDKLWGNFRRDRMDRLYYGDVLLGGINHSPLRKEILSELLIADEHIVPAEKVMSILSVDDDDREKRNRIMSEIKKELRSVSHDIDIKTHRVGRSVDYYELIIR